MVIIIASIASSIVTSFFIASIVIKSFKKTFDSSIDMFVENQTKFIIDSLKNN